MDILTNYCRSLSLVATLAATLVAGSANAITWNEAQRKKEANWFRTTTAQQVVNNVLLYQCPTGGWPKSIDMAAPMTERKKQNLVKLATESTIDNGATFTQLRFLANTYAATHDDRVRAAFNNGLDFLYTAQYANGGWPIFYPLHSGYRKHIHFNDNSVSGVLNLLRDVADGQPPYEFVDAKRRKKAQRAVAKGIDCILKCQVIVDGKPTVWCAQHDEVTLQPAPARTFEPVSLSGHESVGLVRCLMRVDNPPAEIVAAVQGAVAWLEEAKIEGIRVVSVRLPNGHDRTVKADPTAPLIWARFYEIKTLKPIFAGRDGIVHYKYAEIEAERRLNYAYYGYWPAKLLDEEYPAWRSKWNVTGSALNR